jgi:hypothetical protein
MLWTGMMLLKYDLCKLDAVGKMKSKSTYDEICTHLAIHKTLPVSPFRLRRAVLSCISSISTTRSGGRPFLRLFATLDFFTARSECRGSTASSNRTVIVSFNESTWPKPRHPWDVPPSLVPFCRSVYRKNTCANEYDKDHEQKVLASRTSSSASVTTSESGGI